MSLTYGAERLKKALEQGGQNDPPSAGAKPMNSINHRQTPLQLQKPLKWLLNAFKML